MPFGLGFFATAGAGGAAGSFDLLETQVLGSVAASVTFSSLSAFSSYQHLQLRMVSQTDNGVDSNGVAVQMQLNADTGSNYSWHSLDTNVSDSVRSFNAANAGNMRISITDDIYWGPAVVDILDAYETSKFKTVRGFGGVASGNPTYKYVGLYSGNWRNTNAITSIKIFTSSGSNFDAGSRFSLYGLKAA